ncbi:MAG: helix-turn-helix domain-containing protein [Salinarimonas sp.]
MEPVAVSVREAQRLLGGIGRTKLYQLIADGKLRPLKLGRRTLIPISSINDLVHAPSARDNTHGAP